MRTRVSTKGQIVLPAELRARDRVAEGDEFEIERLDDATYRLTRISAAPNAGLVDWLLRSPEKGWFTPVAGDSTDDL
jgi:AbrB family looped-hinge helix DNA binding protein